ncbi:efflux RND transporter permease subunit [Corallincola luteus]|uniref:Efflux RND transporter permease subunit n=1 Tax=Corallincola luteus TaxID=1775177 RepID=A0ABY2AHF8_9GAMM|nr:efflux RND transporter permease subunit [Corallincola luteus]TCI01837.1 efflux RND transporter permease subunit [Corallincola luteus]
MTIAEYSIKNKVISWLLTLIFALGGFGAYLGLGQLEDPEYTIKDAVIVTSYPGASPQQVEEEVTYKLEMAIQQLSYVKEITSISTAGLSQITVTMKNKYGKEALPQIWDELRRKVGDAAPQLPPGASEPLVNDDFGDVYGVMIAFTGEGYSYKELNDYVDFVKREVEVINGVGKVNLAGVQDEEVFVEISYTKMSALGIAPDTIFDLLSTQNIVAPAGSVSHEDEYIRIYSTGEFTNVTELENLIIAGAGSDKLVYLRDVARVYRGYEEIPTNIYNFQGQQAISMGISFASGVNVVDIGKAVRDRMADLEYTKPLGMELTYIYDQPSSVAVSVKGFILNLVAAVVIVVVVLLFFMGVKSGVLIGLILALTVFGSFIFMKQMAIDLQRISLGALIIALGMLVDNAIVVVEGILIGVQKGRTKLQAAVDIVEQTKWPLLGATVIAITAFAPIGLSDDSTGEFAGSLFWVLMISLMMSWFTAITLTPFFANMFFKEAEPQAEGEESKPQEDPYKGAVFVLYKKALDACMRFKWFTLGLMVALLALSIVGFGHVRQAFFPPATTPIFLVDVWLPQGSDIRYTHDVVSEMEGWIMEQPEVKQVTSTTGQGAQRFMLTYEPEKSYSAYAQILINTNSSEEMHPMMSRLRDEFAVTYPQALIKLRNLEIGPSPAGKIEARFTGADPAVLRELGEQAKQILRNDPVATNIRDDWRQRSKLIRPAFDESLARRAGVSRSDLDNTLNMSFSGRNVGLYRDGTDMLPIVVRLPDEERVDITSYESLQIWSPTLQQYIPIQQVAPQYQLTWEDSIIQRRDRKRTLTVIADHDLLGEETAAQVFERVKGPIEAIELPRGYYLEWGGEYEASGDASSALFGSLPMGFLSMFLITVFLFNSFKKPLVIWCCVPLAMIGITFGLLVLDAAFGFMALLGALSLVGMLLKNGIVLLDQINLELESGTEPYEAIFMSGVSRVRPVAMAAITTILGMLPLLGDAFFVDMAVTIMFGLGFATVLTLLVVPVIFMVFHGIKYRPLSEL